MQDDRLQMPEQLEKAFEYLKQAQTPVDFELTKKRTFTWEQVAKRGRRAVLWDRWLKPAVDVLAGTAVMVTAVLVPLHLPDKGVEVQRGNLSSSQGYPPNSNQADEKTLKTKMYERQGEHYLATEPNSGVDLVYASPENRNQNMLYAVKKGVPKEVFEFPKDKHIVLSTIPITDLLAFSLVDNSNHLENGTLYLLNPDVMQVKSMLPGYAKSQVYYSWKPSPTKLYVLYNATQGSSAEIKAWDWDGDGSFKTLYKSDTQSVRSFVTLGNQLILVGSKQIVKVKENGSEVIDQTSNSAGFYLVYDGGGKGDYSMVYSEGALAGTSYGSYHDDVKIKRYDTKSGKSQLLLPNTEGEQHVLAAPPSGDLLIGNYVADDPSKAADLPRMQVPGTYRLWYVKPGSTPKLVYTKKMPGEDLYVALNNLYPVQPVLTRTDLLLVPENNTQSPTALHYIWDKQIVEEVAVDHLKSTGK